MDINATLGLFSLIATALASFIAGAIVSYLVLKRGTRKIILKAYTPEEAKEMFLRLHQIGAL